MLQFKHSSLHLSWHTLAVILGCLFVIVASAGGLALLVLGSLDALVVQALGFALWVLLALLVLGVGSYGVLVLRGQTHSLHRFAPASDRAEEGWSALLLAALGAIWLLVVRIWMTPGPHSNLWILLWLVASVALGFAGIRHGLVRLLVRVFGPRA